MNENLEITKREKLMGFKVSLEEEQEIKDFVVARNWKLSAFIRHAIKNEMKRLSEQNKG